VGLLISQRMPASVELALCGFVVALILAIPAAILAAIYQDSWIDWIVTGFVTVGMAVPSFWLGIMLMLLFSVHLDWLPRLGSEPLFKSPGSTLHHLILPSVRLGHALARPFT